MRAIKRIKVTNFKSFKRLEVKLGKFNVFIGANASGKSNFIQVFEFLRDISAAGLDNAISMQGGAKYLTNLLSDPSADLSLEIELDTSDMPILSLFPSIIYAAGEHVEAESKCASYKLTIRFKEKKIEIIEDELTEVFEFKDRTPHGRAKEISLEGNIRISTIPEVDFTYNLPDQIHLDADAKSQLDFFKKIVSRGFRAQPEGRNKVLLESSAAASLLPAFEMSLNHISIFDFDPKLPKRAVFIKGRAELEEDGSNLAIVLKNILDDKEKERVFNNLIQDLLPFVEKFRVEQIQDTSFIILLEEEFFTNKDLPAPLISDGTINIAALIMALFFDRNPIAIIEEPERNMHPHLVSKTVGMMKEASENKQIIITTHNPQIVKNLSRSELFLVSRDKKGYSSITPSQNIGQLDVFLKNELGIDELYVDNLLESLR